MSENKATILVMISLTLLLLAIFLQQHVMTIDRRYSLYNETDFFSSLIAGSKKFVAHECWIQADVYLHRGLVHEYDGEHDDEHEFFHDSHEEAHHHHDHDVAHNHNGEECPFCGHHHHKDVKPNAFVPYNRGDFTNTKHKTKFDDKELLPWLRLTAYMDPHLTKAYAVGGHWLAWRLGKAEEAIEFLEEGLENNPGAPDILAELGLVYFDANGDLGTRNLEKALEAFNAAMKTEVKPLRRIELLTYRSECHNALGQYEKAIATLDEKIAIMLKHGMESSERLRSTIHSRENLYGKLYSSN